MSTRLNQLAVAIVAFFLIAGGRSVVFWICLNVLDLESRIKRIH